MHAVVAELARVVTERGRPLSNRRPCTVDTTSAPASVRALVDALCTHTWDVALMAYPLRDTGDARVVTLGDSLGAVAVDLDHDLPTALAAAGPDGGPFDPAASVSLCPDEGGMTELGVAWAGQRVFVTVVELEEDPNGDGLLKHLVTPGALVEYLGRTLVGDDHDRRDLDRLAAAARASGDDLAPAAPIRSRGATGPGNRPRPELAPAPAARNVYDVRQELDAAIAADDPAAVGRALAALDGPLVNGSLAILQAWGAFYAATGTRLARAMEVALWIARQPEPTDPTVHAEWLKALSLGAGWAGAPGDVAVRNEVVDRALPYAKFQTDILHNAACALALLGRHADALAAVSEAARLRYPALAALVAEADLAPLRAGGALDAAVARGTAARDPG